MSQRKQLIACLLAAIAVTIAAGCKNNPEQNSDNQIAAALNAANNGEIQTGMLAQTQASNQEVKNFATQMVSEHTAVQQRQTALFSTLAITPTEGSTSTQLQRDAQTMLQLLRTSSGAAFDRVYIDGQVTMHTQVLALLDGNLIPGAARSELRAEMTAMRGAVAQHLQIAMTLQGTLGTDVDGGLNDGGLNDGGLTDGGQNDGGLTDGGLNDGGRTDGGQTDGGLTDGGRTD